MVKLLVKFRNFLAFKTFDLIFTFQSVLKLEKGKSDAKNTEFVGAVKFDINFLLFMASRAFTNREGLLKFL